MGEIADALKKSKAAKGRESSSDSSTSSRTEVPRESDPGSYHEALLRSNQTSGGLATTDESELEVVEADLPTRSINIEAHRHLAVAVRSRLERVSARSMAVVSALRNEGKTTVACNLAAALASLAGEREVALVDLDLRNPSVRRCLGIRPTIGVESFLLGKATVDEVCTHLAEPSLDVFPGLVAQRNAHELLVTPLFESLIRHLVSRYRLVVLDTPPCLILPDANLIMRQVDTCTMVVRSGESRVNRLTEALEALPSDRQLGTILNCASVPSHRRKYEYYEMEPEEDLPEREES